MHVILGGEANGRRRYVRERLIDQAGQAVWLGEESPLDLSAARVTAADDTVVVTGLETWMAGRLSDEDRAAEELLSFIRNRNVFVIVTDIGRGIVPADPAARALRDACGRLTQRLVQEAETVTRIWFGIPQKLK
ncbi:hypothetical protein NCCP2716_16170 [Sporosarcina sp. NCCP-2716]|uniref:bifunctional adenosylcobinamide kinase/adenosylcobinamide-phosphate guanylyltransferase n=1 Tax=Sporosarcina sp. NCCP-2716 TaxID=2943679 RepID=UPI00203D6CD9|nr:bifunctional adenosylcobinamide kinase/adenosylcobinamide-phosphate guanylyltransferase [Sporosarcina sp. NCCP-2716]GKV69119.1 hypothetical protein NCCP2716_16170 [Sporosarcina sp. NCCP-2716]